MRQPTSLKANANTKAMEPLTVVVENETLTLRPEMVPLDEVQLDPKNPRIREYLREKRIKSATPEQLREVIMGMSGVEELYKSIRDNGGLLEPVLIRNDGLIVEGNCRTASYLRLRDTYGAKWNRIPATRLPHATSERQIAVMQALWHVNGKIKWRATEQAGQVHYMNKTLGMSPETIAKSIGLQVKVVLRQIKNYETVTTQIIPKLGRDEGTKKYSYVEEFNKNKELKGFREKVGNERWFLKQLADGKFQRGDHVRDLPRIVKNERAKKAFEEHGHAAAMKVLARRDPTIGSPVFKKLKAATASLRGLTAQELDKIKTDPKAQKLLHDLYQALRDAAKVARVQLK